MNSNPHEKHAYTVGQATVTRIRELTLANITPAALFPDWDAGAEQALFGGDVLHCPLEVYKPDWNTVFDAFPEEARESRMWALKFAADHEAMIFSSHFTASSAGNALRDGSGFRWRFR